MLGRGFVSWAVVVDYDLVASSTLLFTFTSGSVVSFFSSFVGHGLGRRLAEAQARSAARGRSARRACAKWREHSLYPRWMLVKLACWGKDRSGAGAFGGGHDRISDAVCGSAPS